MNNLISVKSACATARLLARYSVAAATRILMRAGISLNWAARYVLSFLRSLRPVAVSA